MTREEQIDWLCRLRTDLNNGVIFTPWNKEFTEALTGILEQDPETGRIEYGTDGNSYRLTISNGKEFDQKPKIGRWIVKGGKERGYDIAGGKTWYIQIMCDKCGFTKAAIEGHTGQYKFCPICGQPKMQE